MKTNTKKLRLIPFILLLSAIGFNSCSGDDISHESSEFLVHEKSNTGNSFVYMIASNLINDEDYITFFNLNKNLLDISNLEGLETVDFSTLETSNSVILNATPNNKEEDYNKLINDISAMSEIVFSKYSNDLQIIYNEGLMTEFEAAIAKAIVDQGKENEFNLINENELLIIEKSGRNCGTNYIGYVEDARVAAAASLAVSAVVGFFGCLPCGIAGAISSRVLLSYQLGRCTDRYNLCK
jgi:hypothetical protein